MNKIDSTSRFSKVKKITSMIAWIVSEENSFTTVAFFDLSGGKTFS